MSIHWNPAPNILDSTVSLDTLCVAARPARIQSAQEPVVVPIYHTSTYKIKDVDEYIQILATEGEIYSRCGNPTVQAAETAVNAIEGGVGSLLFSSGMAAIQCALTGSLSSGDHVIICNPVYSGTHSFVQNHLVRFGIEVTFTSADSIDDYRKHIKDNTKVLYAETPRNPDLSIIDLAKLVALAREKNLLTIVDGTFASPYLQQSIKLGVDISMHSCTKFLGGHSDLLGGVLTFKCLQKWKYFKRYSTTIGSTMNPWEASLLMRGIKTLHLRVHRSCDNAEHLANVLQTHSAVRFVHYPGLPNSPGHEIAEKQMRRFGAMISFDLKGGLNAGKLFTSRVKLINFAVSLGGVDSLVEHPASMTHGSMIMSDADRLESRVTDGLIRLSVGIENVDDLQNDLLQALEGL